MKFLSKYNDIVLPAMAMVMGIVFVALSIYMGVATKSFTGSTMATIVNIEEHVEWVGAGDDEHPETVYTQFITYRVKGVKYENVEFGSCDEDAQIGDRIEIKYDEDDPARITDTDTSTPKIVGGISAVFILAGGFVLFRNLKRRN